MPHSSNVTDNSSIISHVDANVHIITKPSMSSRQNVTAAKVTDESPMDTRRTMNADIHTSRELKVECVGEVSEEAVS